jgi:hypothetical protein
VQTGDLNSLPGQFETDAIGEAPLDRFRCRVPVGPLKSDPGQHREHVENRAAGQLRRDTRITERVPQKVASRAGGSETWLRAQA